jgi:hypothetical protein
MSRLLHRDVYAGCMFALLGIAGLWLSRDYVFGTPTRMGPGFFPRSISTGLLILGVLIVARGLVSVRVTISIDLRPVPMVLGAVVVFALLIERAGLPIATVACIMVSTFASREARWRESLVLALGLAAAATALFVFGLGMPIPIWPA